jgi:hypothetical protein
VALLTKTVTASCDSISTKWAVPPGKKLVQIGAARKILGIPSGSEAGDIAAEEIGDAESGDELGEQASGVEAVPNCYHKDSRLFVNVDGITSVFNFDLKSDCSTVGSNYSTKCCVLTFERLRGDGQSNQDSSDTALALQFFVCRCYCTHRLICWFVADRLHDVKSLLQSQIPCREIVFVRRMIFSLLR